MLWARRRVARGEEEQCIDISRRERLLKSRMAKISESITGEVHSRMVARYFLFAFHLSTTTKQHNENRACLFNAEE